MTIGIGIIGYGRATQVFHLPLLKSCPAFKVIGIASSKTSNELPIDIQHYATPSELLQNHQIEAVVIVTPNDSHYALAKAALLANKHVVLEKPMCLTVEEGQELISLAQQQQRLLTVFHNRRLDSDFLTLRQIIAENRVGNIHRLISCWDRYRPHVQPRWREQNLPGSGIWYDLGPHLIDQALQLFGAPQTITGRCLILRPHSEAIDYAQITLHYPDKEVLLGTSPYCSAPNPRYRLEGELGTYVKYSLDPQEDQLKAGLAIDDIAFGAEMPEAYGIYYDENSVPHRITSQKGRFVDFYLNLAAAINGNSPLLVQPEQALEVIKIITLAQRSSDEQKTLSYSD